MAVVKNLMVRAGADFSGLSRSMKKAQQDLASFKTGVTRTMKGIAGALAAIGIGRAIKESTKDAMTFEASMQQIDRTLGQSASRFKMWSKENATALGMSRLEAAKYGAVYANLISGFSRDTEETTKRTQDLLKASAIVASATGRTMEDTMERIRSGLLGNTEAIEDLGINVNVAMIESTKAFKQFANGKSWQKLDFQTQQQIRLMAILEQATVKYGDTLANNTASRHQQFIAHLNNAKLAMGQAFMVIYNVILPALTSFARALDSVMTFIAQFTQALFGTAQAQKQVKATSAQASAVTGLGDAYKAAGKEAKKATASFDDLNLVGGKDSAGAGSETGIAAGETLPSSDAHNGLLNGMDDGMGEVSDKAKQMADKVKAAFSAMKDAIVQNKEIIIAALAGLATAFAGFWLATQWGTMVSTLKAAGTAIMGVLTAVSLPIALLIGAVAALVGAFVYFYRTNEQFRDTVHDILQRIGDTAIWLWQTVMVPFGAWLGSAMVEAWNAMGNATTWLWQTVLQPFGAWLMEVMPKAWNAVATAAMWLWQNVLAPFGNFLLWLWQNVLVPLGKIIGEVLVIAFEAVSKVAKSFWDNVLTPLSKAVGEILVAAVKDAITILEYLWNNVFEPLAHFISMVLKVAFAALMQSIMELWQRALRPLAEFLGGVFMSVFDNVFRSIGTIIEGLKTAFIGLMSFITGVFTADWRRAWEGVRDVFDGIFQSLYGLVKFPLNLIIDAINAVIGGLNSLSIDIPDWVPKFGGESIGISIPKIPKLAKGGAAYGPTLAVIGDNPNASIDPEVVAPFSKLKELITPQGNDNRETNSLLSDIRQALRESGGDIIMMVRDTELGRASIKSINKVLRQTNLTLEV